MKLPTAEEISTIKAQAMKRFGSDRALLVELESPIDVAVVVAPFGLEAWAAYADLQARDLETSHATAFAERVLWPSLDHALELCARWPAVPRNVAVQLHAAAGQVTGKPLVRRLSAAAPPKGLGQREAQQLIDQYAGASLWAVEQTPAELSCVMRTPAGDVYLAAKTADRLAREKGEGLVMAMLPYARESVIWSADAHPIASLIERRPAISDDLRTAFLMLGGEGVAVRSKSL
jgi:hypothetical protein